MGGALVLPHTRAVFCVGYGQYELIFAAIFAADLIVIPFIPVPSRYIPLFMLTLLLLFERLFSQRSFLCIVLSS